MCDAVVRPIPGIGAMVRRDDRVLLVRRGQEPYAGQWAVPGGKLEPGETLAAAVERELWEECQVRVRCGELAYHFEYIEHDDEGRLKFHYVVLDYHAEWLAGEPEAGSDALEVRWVGLDELDCYPINPFTLKALRTVYADSLPPLSRNA